MSSLLIITLVFPFAAAALMLLLDSQAPASRARWSAVFASVATLALAAGLAAGYRTEAHIAAPTDAPLRPLLAVSQTWLTLATESTTAPIELRFELGVDGIGIAMILLTALLTLSAVLVSWNSVPQRASEFFASLLVLEGSLIGVFCSFDLILFYVFFELTLLPQFLMIGVWGGLQRRYAAGKVFLYLLGSSLVTLLGLVALAVTAYQHTGLTTPFSIPALAQALRDHPLPVEIQGLLFLPLAAGFLVKAPIFPFHSWLPLVHGEAPTAVLLTGVVMKLGPFGLLRLALPLLPEGTVEMGLPVVGLLAVIGVVYGSLCALVQNDLFKLIAYSSLAHVAVSLLGLLSFTREGVTGGVVHMINLGLSTGALLCLVAMVSQRYQTRRISDLGGLASRLPALTALMAVAVFASIGLPGLNGFIGEILSLAGLFQVQRVYAVIATTGVILAAWYTLGVLQTVFFGPRVELETEGPVTDLTPREWMAVIPLVGLCLYLGLWPQTLIDVVAPDIAGVVSVTTPVTEPAVSAVIPSLR